MKRPLQPNEVPPGILFRLKTDLQCERNWQWKNDQCIKLASAGDGDYFTPSYQELLENFEILRPGQDWQPCWVDEFNPADYQPGQLVDEPTADKLARAGVALEYKDSNGDWVKHGGCFFAGHPLRVAAPPVMRDLRPDELPPMFLADLGEKYPAVVDVITINNNWLKWCVNNNHKWSRSLDGPWNSFQVEEK